MNVAIVQEHLDMQRGGAETSTCEMARCLAEIGLHVTLVAAGAADETQPIELPGGATGRLSVQRVAVGGGSKLGRTMQFVGAADRYCRETGFNIIHAITPCFSCNVYQPRGGTYVETIRRSIERAPLALRWLKRLGRRLNRRQRFLLLVERRMLSDASAPHIAAISQYVARQIREACATFPLEKVHLIFNGVDVAPVDADTRAAHRAKIRTALSLDPATPVVLFVAHNFKLKGLRELLDAFALVLREQPDATLLVIGRDERGPYERRAARLEIASAVRFLEPAAEVAPFYAAADVLAHPTWYDPCSRVVLEALCHGLPVVTTRFNGAAEVVQQGKNGVVIDTPGDAAELAAAIGQCLTPKLRDICIAGAAQMCEQLSMRRHARELKALYERIG